MANLLVPVDGSALGDGVLPMVRAIQSSGELEIVLLRVLSDEEQEPALRAAAEQHLEELRDRLEGEGVPVRTRLEEGHPAEQILAVAEELSPGLLAMSTHGRSGVDRLMRGSVAERVLRRATCPLLLCNREALESPQESPFQRILVPLDGSPQADQILPLVEEFALAFGSRVILFRVEPFLYSAVPSPALTQESAWDPSTTIDSLQPQRERLEQRGIQVEVEAAYGVEAAEILSAAERADLIAMTSHGRRGVSRWWFGSVAESVLRHCALPVLVLRAHPPVGD